MRILSQDEVWRALARVGARLHSTYGLRKADYLDYLAKESWRDLARLAAGELAREGNR
jgi:hypothetical protein